MKNEVTTVVGFRRSIICTAKNLEKLQGGLRLNMLAYALSAARLEGISTDKALADLQTAAAKAGYTGGTVKKEASNVRAAISHGILDGVTVGNLPFDGDEAAVIQQARAYANRLGYSGIEAAREARAAENGGSKGGKPPVTAGNPEPANGTLGNSAPPPRTAVTIQADVMAGIGELRALASTGDKAATNALAAIAKALVAPAKVERKRMETPARKAA
jgi:hypothetical protein